MASRRARELRKNMTDAELLLWQHLRNRQLGGYKFRRQKPIGPFIADFVCIEKRLIIEVDGSQHAERMRADERRTRYLEGHGFKVVRFWNNEVIRECEPVLIKILSVLRK